MPLLWYDDGLHVRRAHSAWTGLIGARLVSIEGSSELEVFERLLPLVSRESIWRGFATAPNLMTSPDLLRGAGISQHSASVTCQFQTKVGRRQVDLPALPSLMRQFETWTYATPDGLPGTLDQSATNLKCSGAPGCDGLLYLKFDSVQDDANDTLADRFDAAFRLLDVDKMTGVVIDVRQNEGGDNRLIWPLIEGIESRPSINQPVRLFALIGRKTFSAALHCVLWLQRYIECEFVGEPTGSSPNHFGAAVDHQLPNKGLTAAVSSLWCQESFAYDDPTALTPDQRVQYTAANYARGHDPALAHAVERFQASTKEAA